MQFTKEDLLTLSRLARISISKEEEDKMLHDMQAILQHVSEINEITLPDTLASFDHSNIVREDVVIEETSTKRDIILQNAPDTEEEYIKVTQVLQA